MYCVVNVVCILCVKYLEQVAVRYNGFKYTHSRNSLITSFFGDLSSVVFLYLGEVYECSSSDLFFGKCTAQTNWTTNVSIFDFI